MESCRELRLWESGEELRELIGEMSVRSLFGELIDCCEPKQNEKNLSLERF